MKAVVVRVYDNLHHTGHDPEVSAFYRHGILSGKVLVVFGTDQKSVSIYFSENEIENFPFQLKDGRIVEKTGEVDMRGKLVFIFRSLERSFQLMQEKWA